MADTPDPQQRFLSPREQTADNAFLAPLNAADDYADGDLIVGNLYTLHAAVTAVWGEHEKQLRAERDALKAAIERVRAFIDNPNDRRPWESRVVHHRFIREALDTPTIPESPDEPRHIGGRANAEDCPACSGTNPPYPFICPGEPESPDGDQ